MLNENSLDRSLIKYTRKYLLEIFDALHYKSEFKYLSIDNFFKYIISRGVQYKKRFLVNINDNSNVLIGKSDINTSNLIYKD